MLKDEKEAERRVGIFYINSFLFYIKLFFYIKYIR